MKDEKAQKKTGKKLGKGHDNLIPGIGGGRPKGLLNFKTRLQMAINRLALEYVQQHNAKPGNKKNQITVDDVDIMGDVFAQYINKARNGSEKVIDSLLDRAYGKAKQPVEHSGSIENTVEMNIKIEEAKKKAKAMQDKWVKT